MLYSECLQFQCQHRQHAKIRQRGDPLSKRLWRPKNQASAATLAFPLNPAPGRKLTALWLMFEQDLDPKFKSLECVVVGTNLDWALDCGCLYHLLTFGNSQDFSSQFSHLWNRKNNLISLWQPSFLPSSLWIWMSVVSCLQRGLTLHQSLWFNSSSRMGFHIQLRGEQMLWKHPIISCKGHRAAVGTWRPLTV